VIVEGRFYLQDHTLERMGHLRVHLDLSPEECSGRLVERLLDRGPIAADDFEGGMVHAIEQEREDARGRAPLLRRGAPEAARSGAPPGVFFPEDFAMRVLSLAMAGGLLVMLQVILSDGANREVWTHRPPRRRRQRPTPT